ncbi:MAG: hypothetical protein WBG37_10380 [Desulfobacterales bacterium]
MALRDLFVPKLAHSNPEVRKKAVMKQRDPGVLKQVIEKDQDPKVVNTAKKRLKELSS